jgi:hypothetical protein
MSRDVFSLSVAAPRQRWKLVLPLFTNNNNNNNNNLCCQLIAEFLIRPTVRPIYTAKPKTIE